RHWIADAAPVASARRIEQLPGNRKAPRQRPDPGDWQEGAEAASIHQLDAQTPEGAGPDVFERLKRDIASLVASLVEVEEQEIDFDEELRAYGFDSINLAALAQGIAQKLDIDITASALFGYPSVAACAESLWASNQDKLLKHYHGEEGRTVNAVGLV